jgi:hypothetical protein
MEATADKKAEAVAIAKTEILADIEAGRVPATVTTFSELHDHVDANYYGHAFEALEACGEDAEACSEVMDLYNEVQGDLDLWLRAGRPSE